MGFGAQTVAETAHSLDMGDLSLYVAKIIDETGDEGYYKEEADDSKLSWGLKYNEFIAPMVASIQALNDRIAEKDKIIQEQNEKIDNLSERLETLEKLF